MAVAPCRTVNVASLIVAGAIALLNVAAICLLIDTFVAAFDGPVATTVGGVPVEVPASLPGPLSSPRPNSTSCSPHAGGSDIRATKVAVGRNLMACCLPGE